MRNDLIAIVVVSLATATTVAAILLDIQVPTIRQASGLLLAFVLPGYALGAVAFPNLPARSTTRLMMTLGASLTITVIGGLLINWTSWGLQAKSWVVLLGGITLIACAGASKRGLHEGPRDRTTSVGNSVRNYSRLINLLPLLALVITLGAFRLVVSTASVDVEAGVTQLWLLRSDADSDTIKLGVKNDEPGMMAYALRLEIDGSTFSDWPLIELRPRQAWETSIKLPRQAFDQSRIDAILTRSGDSMHVYRRVTAQVGS